MELNSMKIEKKRAGDKAAKRIKQMKIEGEEIRHKRKYS
jgi:phage terminase large subunit-like protein